MKTATYIVSLVMLASSTSYAVAAQTGITLKLSVPVVCTLDVEMADEFGGTFRELCNVLDPYDAVLLHDAFDEGQQITLNYDETTISLDPSGRTELATHPRGGLFKRDFRVSGASADFVMSFRGEAMTDQIAHK